MIYRKILVSSCILLLFFSIGIVIANEEDNVTGYLALSNIANDSPIFTDWYNTSVLIDPFIDVSFYAEVFDIDNTSGQLTITLYYSEDSFNSQNLSVSMNYISKVSANTYRYNYTMTGRPDGTYMQYYYQAFDGENRVKEDDSGFYYDIQWLFPAITIDVPLPPDVDYERPIIEVPNILFIFVTLMLLLSVIAIFMNMSKRRIETV
jgi:hypothetical protein